jgi:ribonuclease BN (tRNA processing enzyme)
MSLALRFDHGGRGLVYAPNNELESAEEVSSYFTEKMRRLVRGAAVPLHDSRFSDEDFPAHRSQGSSCPKMALELALWEGVRRLVLFHLDPGYGSDEMDRILRQARRSLEENCHTLQVDLAAPGQVIDIY